MRTSPSMVRLPRFAGLDRSNDVALVGPRAALEDVGIGRHQGVRTGVMGEAQPVGLGDEAAQGLVEPGVQLAGAPFGGALADLVWGEEQGGRRARQIARRPAILPMG